MKEMRTGFTTGTCAAAAAKAATMVLCGQPQPGHVEIPLPDNTRVTLPIEASGGNSHSATATVKKDAGDDPDVTDGCMVVASVDWSDSGKFTILRGEGVGLVTKPGLSVPMGEPAINPVPRRMIRDAVNEVTERAVSVTISIPGGQALADKTFNPRLGVVGGLSILGTSGIVRPFSTPALREALKCALNVATACQVLSPVFVPGRIGAKAAKKHFRIAPEQLIEVGNEWGFVLDEASKAVFERLLVLGHPGKLAKLAAGEWDTHSARSESAAPFVEQLAQEVFGRSVPESQTVEGIFSALEEKDAWKLAEKLAHQIRQAVSDRLAGRFPVSVLLVNMRGKILGHCGAIEAWE
jgi:cobalt-precorrin-5B (C1)-methyltransferase